MSEADNNTDSPSPSGKNVLEWLIFGLGLVLVAGTLGVLVYEMIIWQDRPAQLVAKVGGSYQESGLTWVAVDVKNEGDRPAEQVEVTVESISPNGDGNGAGEPQEEATFTLEEVPRGAVRKGRVSFPEDHAGRLFRAAVTGFSGE